MKVFNKGGRKFVIHEIHINPGVKTEIPDKYSAEAEKLLKNYPDEILTAEDADKRASLREQQVTDLQGQVEELKGKLATVATGDSAEAAAELKAAVIAAEKIAADRTADARAAVDRIHELEQLLAQRDDQIATLKSQLSGKGKKHQ
jgi:deoxyribodipyrimidine photolyase